MKYEKLDTLPALDTFAGLKRNDKVYSSKYGIGTVMRFHNDEIIVAFKEFRKRLSIHEEGIAKIPDEYFKKTRSKVEVTYAGSSMSLRKYKGIRRKEKRIEKMINEYNELSKSKKAVPKEKQLKMDLPK